MRLSKHHPVRLSLKHVAELQPSAPFHFDATVHKPDHFPSADNAWQPGVRWQTMRFEEALLGLKLENTGSVERPSIRLSVWTADERDPGFYERLGAEIEYRFNLGSTSLTSTDASAATLSSDR